MTGAPLPLRLEAITRECANHADPDTTQTLVLTIEDEIYRIRLKNYADKQEQPRNK